MSANSVSPLEESKIRYRLAADSACAQFLANYTVQKVIDCGSSGCVYQLCTADGKCDLVVKLTAIVPHRHNDGTMALTDEMVSERLNNEMLVAVAMGKLEVGPKVIFAMICPGQTIQEARTEWIDVNILFIVMDKMDMTLRTYLSNIKGSTNYKKIEKDANKEVIKLDDAMTDAGWVHRDLRNYNVMVDVNHADEITKIRLIDFGAVNRRATR